MKTAADAAALLDEIRRLMEFRGENPFKVRAFERASNSLSGRTDLMELAKAGALTSIEGIGKGISEVLSEYLLKGTSSLRDELAAALPAGVMELTQIPGLGPKKAIQLIEELDIHSVRELEYACKENRLLKLKGFGDKVQKKILDGIQFMNATAGQQRLDDAFTSAESFVKVLLEAVNENRQPVPEGLRVSEAGTLRRRMEVQSVLDFLVEVPTGEKAASKVMSHSQNALQEYQKNNFGVLPVKLHFSDPDHYGYELARLTASEEHWKALGSPPPFTARTEEEFYEKLDLPWIPPETRETGEEVTLARAGQISSILPWNAIQGVFHNHTVRSDGNATLEEMVIAAKTLGFKYIGISDHSQSAFYAQGLKVPTLLEQEKEIRSVQEKHPEIKIFWGIESDILADGSLDYDASVLKKFDFVVASVHSRFQMDREAMTERIVEAVRNPYTRFLGHATGRLLLGRKGYEVDMEKIIHEAARHDVAIEINAHPARLDIDWRWGCELRKRGTKVSVNPDAHDTEGLEVTRYGIAMARKALMPSSLVVNSGGVEEVSKWLSRA